MNARVIVLTLILPMAVAGLAEASTLQCSSAPVGNAHRSLATLRTDVHAALRTEAATRSAGDNTPEVLRLVELFHELAAHPRRDESATLRRLGQQLRSRLERVRDQIGRQSADPDRGAKKEGVLPKLAEPKNRALAQRAGLPGGAAAGAGARLAGAPAAVGRPNDFGPELVELIEQTISPATWNINGGNGSVVYYAPLRALVIRAPADIHAQVGGTLGQLRADR